MVISRRHGCLLRTAGVVALAALPCRSIALDAPMCMDAATNRQLPFEKSAHQEVQRHGRPPKALLQVGVDMLSELSVGGQSNVKGAKQPDQNFVTDDAPGKPVTKPPTSAYAKGFKDPDADFIEDDAPGMPDATLSQATAASQVAPVQAQEEKRNILDTGANKLAIGKAEGGGLPWPFNSDRSKARHIEERAEEELEEKEKEKKLWGYWVYEDVQHFAFACFFFSILGGIPVCHHHFSTAKGSFTQTCHTVGLLVWAASGFIMFRWVIVFQAAHWNGAGHLTLVQTCYLMSQVITTVGYGDITPAYPPGRMFLCVWVLAGLILIADMISNLGDEVSTSLEDHVTKIGAWIMKLMRYLKRGGRTLDPVEEQEVKAALEAAWSGAPVKTDWLARKTPLPYLSLAKATIFYIICSSSGVFFFFRQEGKPFEEALYMSIITLSTVGFGAVTPTTDAGMAFSTFWMIIGSWSLLNVVNKVSAFSKACRTKSEMFGEKRRKEFAVHTKFYTETGIERLDQYEFMKIMLLHTKMATEEDFVTMEDIFNGCGPDKYRTVALQAVEEAAFSSEFADDG